MSLNPKTLIVGLFAAVLLGIGAFSFAEAGIRTDDTPYNGCTGLDSDTVANQACLGVVNLGDSNLHDADNSCWDAVPSGLATTGAGVITSGAVLAHTINDIVPICFQHYGGGTSDTPVQGGPITFDANDVGRVLAVICSQTAGNATADFEFTTSSVVTNTAFDGPDECVGYSGKGTDLVVVPVQDPGYLFFYQCPPVNSIANITLQHEQEIIAFSITCLGPAAQATIGVSPSTVEIVPAPGNQSYSRVTVTVADALGNRIDGVEVDFITDNCWWRGEVASQDFGTVSPRGGLDANVRTHVSFSDTDVSGSSNEEGEGTAQDTAYINTVVGQVSGVVTNLNPTTGVRVAAGTAESVLQCFPGTDNALAALVKPGPANIQAIVRRTGTPGLCPINNTGVAATNTNSLSALTSSSYAECGALFGFPLNFARNTFLPFGYEDIILTATVTVIGPPASITVAASPTSLRCGEKATITATIKDAIGANVSDHTRVELITNLGGVLAGTGAVTSGLGAGVVPISSTVAETFAGVATAFLLTSEVTTGPYEVVVTAGGSFPVNFGLYIPSQTSFTQSSTANAIPGPYTYVGGGGDVSPISGIQEPGTVGVFSTAPVSAQATVTCTLPAPPAPPAPQVTAPRTGTGTITPPSTGDAGLADASGNGWTLIAFGALAAFAIAGVVSFKAARR